MSTHSRDSPLNIINLKDCIKSISLNHVIDDILKRIFYFKTKEISMLSNLLHKDRPDLESQLNATIDINDTKEKDAYTSELRRLSHTELINFSRDLFVAYSILKVQFSRLTKIEHINHSLEQSFIDLVRRLQSEKQKTRELHHQLQAIETKRNAMKRHTVHTSPTSKRHTVHVSPTSHTHSYKKKKKTQKDLFKCKTPDPDTVHLIKKKKKKKDNTPHGRGNQLVNADAFAQQMVAMVSDNNNETKDNVNEMDNNEEYNSDDENIGYLKKKHTLKRKTVKLEELQKTFNDVHDQNVVMDNKLNAKAKKVKILLDAYEID